MIDVAEAEHAQLSSAVSRFHGHGEGAVVGVDVDFAHAVSLKYSFGRTQGDECEVVASEVRRKLNSVKGSLDGRVSEVGDQALRDAGLNQSRERRVFGLDLVAVEVLKAADLEAAAEIPERDESLLQEAADCVRAIAIRHVIVRAQAELALRRCHDRVVGQAYERDLFAFKVPVEMLAALADGESEQGMSKRIVVVSVRDFEEIPSLGSCTPVHREIERAQFVAGSGSVLFLGCGGRRWRGGWLLG